MADRPEYLSLEESQRRQIDRLHARLEVEKIQNDAMRELLAAKDFELRQWQELAVELGAFAAVTKDKSRMSLECSLMIDAGLLAKAKDRDALITTLLAMKVRAPMLAECERSFGPQRPPRAVGSRYATTISGSPEDTTHD